MKIPQILTIEWIKAAYKNKELTPRELLKEIIKREAEHADKNIWIIRPSANIASVYINALKEEDMDSLPLWGIPFVIKDNIDLEYYNTTAACKEYSYVAKESATVVAKLIRCGAIPIGKANLDQFATGLVGVRSPYGECHNAYQPELISGGSSSGSAVSVALGMAAFALGTDTAGSGRVPAALNALIGYKPPVGAWSTKGVVPACASLDCVTVFANRLEDVILVNQCARGYDEDCCWSKELPEPTRTKPKKIYLSEDALEFYGDYEEIYRNKWRKAESRILQIAEQNGITVEYIDYTLFADAASILYDGPWVAERWKDLGGFITSHPGAALPVTETILKSGSNPEHTAEQLFISIHKLENYRHITKKLMKDAVLILPTVGGTFTREQVRMDPIVTNSKMGLYTNHCNLLDLCAIAVPEDSNDRYIPFGITIFGLSNSEGLLLNVADSFLSNNK